MSRVVRWTADSDALSIVLALPADSVDRGEDGVEALLRSDAEGVALLLGPSTDTASWPAWARGQAIYGRQGGALALRLDPARSGVAGQDAVNALDLVGRGERSGLRTALAPLPDQLASLGGADDALLRQTVAVLRGLVVALDGPVRQRSSRPPARPELFEPSDLPVGWDDLCETPAWSHVRLTYRLPRLRGRWVEACSWRLFRDRHAFGIEFRALEGDHLPAALLPFCVEDQHGPLLRVSVERDAAAERRIEARGLDADAQELVASLARQAVRDIVPAGTGTPMLPPFASLRWRHWLRALPDLIATAPRAAVQE